jgi:hypothetical protein
MIMRNENFTITIQQYLLHDSCGVCHKFSSLGFALYHQW